MILQESSRSLPRWRLAAVTVLVLTLGSPGLAEEAPPTPSLGEADFPTSASVEAQKAFLEGVLYLHSFEYRDAREAFRRAQEIEPQFALAYWGEAMTYNHPVWLQENREEARDALGRLAPTPEERAAMAPTAREKAYLQAVEILFGDGEKRQRDAAYAEAMKAMTEAYPEDLEAASFYALALIGTCHDGRDFATYMEAAAVAEEVFDKNPRHPGAAHYLIHAYDDPIHAPLGLRPARIYADIAPSAEHALHMPSHIFLALGMWPETVASNIDSWEAAESRVESHDEPVDRRGYHALLWMHYAELQLGQFAKATELLNLMAADAEISGSVRTRTHFALMRAHQVVESEGRSPVPDGPPLEGLRLSTVAADLFATGYAALHSEEIEEARRSLGQIREAIAREQKAAGGEETGCGAGYSSTRSSGAGEAEIMALQLEALLQAEDGKAAEAIATLEEAVRREEETGFGYGPPVPVKPSHELLGEVLLSQNRREDAAKAFERALERAPGRTLSVKGQGKAAAESADAAASAAR